MSKSKYLTIKDFNDALPKEVASLFKIKSLENKTSLIIVFHEFGKVDFSKLSIERAQQLVGNKAYFIELKPKTKKESVDL
jgi:hypothetical protein